MLPYVFLLFCPFLCSFLAIDNHTVLAGKSNRIRISNFSLPCFFSLLFFILALRHETIGRDLVNYKLYFQTYSSVPLSSLLSFDEPIYKILNWLVGKMIGSYQVFLAVVAFICIFPLAMIYCENRRYSYLTIVLFLNMPIFIMMFSGLRQAIAISLGMIAYSFVRKRKLLFFLLSVLLSVGFHKSAFILFPMYWVYHMRFKRQHLWIVLPAMAFLFVFNGPIFSFLLTVIPEYTDKYDAVAGETGAFTMLILFALFVLFSYLVANEEKMDEEMYGLRNFLLVCLAIQCFAPIHNLAMRLNYYYIAFIPIAVAKVFSYIRIQYRQIARLAYYVMCGFFTVYFLYTSYVSCVTGISLLDTFPYVPFWRG